MRALTSWFIRNPVAANLLMALILFAGVQTLMGMRIEGFPRIPPETVEVRIELPDATAEQVADSVTAKVEQALEGIENVRSITSQSTHGVAQISIRKQGGADLQKILDKVRLRVDSLQTLPQRIRRPVIEASEFSMPALYVNLYGPSDPSTLRALAQRLKAELLAQPELSRLQIWGSIPREFRVEVDPQRLRQLGLTVSDVTQAIRANSLDAPAGELRTEGGSIQLVADDRALYRFDYAAIPLIERGDGGRVLLGDVAELEDGFVEGDYLFRYNGQPTVGMEVLIGQKENLLKISAVVDSVVEDFTAQLPAPLQISVWGSSAGYIEDRLNLLKSNGLQGLLLVAFTLALFLNLRLALWVALGIPIAVLGAIAVAGSSWVDYSLNDVTTFGLILVLGILVDDAVVVGESVFEERAKGDDAIVSTERGVERVAVATVFGVLTTIAAFYPMLLIENPLGKALAGFSGIVILALVFSLIESKLVLPAHLAATSLAATSSHSITRAWSRVQRRARGLLLSTRDALYRPILEVCLRYRYAVLVLFLTFAVAGLGLLAKGKVDTVFFPDVPGQVVSIQLEMDARAPFSLTNSNLERIERLGKELNQELQLREKLTEPPIKTFFTIIDSPRNAQLFAELLPSHERSGVSVLELAGLWRERVGLIEGATEFEVTGSENYAGGFQIQLLSKDQHLLQQASDEVRSYLGRFQGVSNLRDSLEGGQSELRLKLRPEARSLGFSAEDLATQIAFAYGGAEVARVQRDGSELRVVVRNASVARDTIDDLIRTHLRSASGAWVPLETVAELRGAYASNAVFRRDGKRINVVQATIDRSVVAPEEVAQALFEQLVPDLKQRYPGIEIRPAGELEELGEIRGGLRKALMLSALLIYILMAVPLKSYSQPLVILAIVPFGFVGAAIGHWIMDVQLSLFSFFGMLALSGVIVNDSLVMITRYNQAKDAGDATHMALRTAGISRFQAIFLTTATTVIGLMPLLSETSEQAQYLIPAAVCLAFGELFGTVLMLILVPVLLAIADDCRAVLAPAARKPSPYAELTGQ